MLSAGFTFSQSSLQDYAACPRRFRLRYLEGLEYPALESEPSEIYERHVREGQHFHRMAQQVLLGIPEQKVARSTGSPDLERWWQAFSSFYHTELFNAQELLPEVSLAAPLGRTRLLAKFDLLAADGDGRLRIYDWKTYRKRPREDRLAGRWQTRVYRALLVRAGAQFNGGNPVLPESCEMVYWFSNFPAKPARFQYTEAQFQLDWAALEKLVAEIMAAAAQKDQDRSFPLTDDQEQCAYCQYRSYCSRGVQAGDVELIEAEGLSEETFDLDFDQIGEIAF